MPEKIDIKLIEASYDLGANFSKTFWHIILPLSMPGVRAGFFLVYVVSFGEYVIPSLIGGQKHFFVGTLISEYFLIKLFFIKSTIMLTVASFGIR